jgi:hypothetical protein
MKDSNIDLGEVVCSNELNGRVARRSDMKSFYDFLVENPKENVPLGALELSTVAPLSPTSGAASLTRGGERVGVE